MNQSRANILYAIIFGLVVYAIGVTYLWVALSPASYQAHSCIKTVHKDHIIIRVPLEEQYTEFYPPKLM